MDALVTAAKNGDKEAFVQLIRMNKQSLYKAAWVYLRNEQDIADALQNAILSCYENIQVNNPVPVSLLSDDRKPQIRFLGNHHSGSGNLYHKSFRM